MTCLQNPFDVEGFIAYMNSSFQSDEPTVISDVQRASTNLFSDMPINDQPRVPEERWNDLICSQKKLDSLSTSFPTASQPEAANSLLLSPSDDGLSLYASPFTNDTTLLSNYVGSTGHQVLSAMSSMSPAANEPNFMQNVGAFDATSNYSLHLDSQLLQFNLFNDFSNACLSPLNAFENVQKLNPLDGFATLPNASVFGNWSENGFLQNGVATRHKDDMAFNMNLTESNTNQTSSLGTKSTETAYHYFTHSNLGEDSEGPTIGNSGKEQKSLAASITCKRRSTVIHEHKCTYGNCRKSFVLKDDLMRHLEKHFDAQRKHECKLCNLSFLLERDLSRHFECVHNNETRLKLVCRVCSKGFSREDSMKRHFKSRKHQRKEESLNKF